MGKRILLLGAGGYASVVAEIIQTLKDEDNNSLYDCIDYLDDNSKKAIGKIEHFDRLGKTLALVDHDVILKNIVM